MNKEKIEIEIKILRFIVMFNLGLTTSLLIRAFKG